MEMVRIVRLLKYLGRLLGVRETDLYDLNEDLLDYKESKTKGFTLLLPDKATSLPHDKLNYRRQQYYTKFLINSIENHTGGMVVTSEIYIHGVLDEEVSSRHVFDYKDISTNPQVENLAIGMRKCMRALEGLRIAIRLDNNSGILDYVYYKDTLSLRYKDSSGKTSTIKLSCNNLINKYM